MSPISAEGDSEKSQIVYERVILNFDGGIREGLMAYGFVAYDPDNHETILFDGKGKCGKGTSNLAEYRALICGLMACRRHGVQIVHVFGDSQLIINQVNQACQVNNPGLISHRDRVLELLGEFESWTIKWVRRLENRQADSLVNQVFEKSFSGRGKKCKAKPSKRRLS